MTNKYRTKADIELVYTTSYSKTTTDSCVVLLPGLPYNPNKKYELKTYLNSDQYDVYTIHYDGTWGSSGSFLKHNPVKSVNDFIEGLSHGKISNTAGKSYKNIFIIGTSFGGGLALTLKNHPALKAVCALSPVTSYESVHGLETLGEYLRAEHPENYTFDKKDMHALITDQIIFPDKQMELPKDKVLIFAGEHDEQVQVDDILRFCSKHNIDPHILPTGHITFSEVNTDIYEKIAISFGTNSANSSTI